LYGGPAFLGVLRDRVVRLREAHGAVHVADGELGGVLVAEAGHAERLDRQLQVHDQVGGNQEVVQYREGPVPKSLAGGEGLGEGPPRVVTAVGRPVGGGAVTGRHDD